VQGVGQGTVLGGRYALRHRLSQDHELERWSAHDTTLLREVTLTIVGSDHPNNASVLDAARRAAGVEDTRLVRILDVGLQDESSFIVEETMSGSVSLASILLHGPVPAEEARRVAGETAKGLETATHRGLHHLRLTPHHVMIAPDGTVRLSGVAVAGAIEEPAEQGLDAATASRRDAICLVALVYAALTGRWPLDEEVSGVEPAPRVVDGVVAPSEIATGVPADLDTLCRLTFNGASGPLTPGEFADQIAPWPRDRVHRADADATAVLALPSPHVDTTAVLPLPSPHVDADQIGDTEHTEHTEHADHNGHIDHSGQTDRAEVTGEVEVAARESTPSQAVQKHGRMVPVGLTNAEIEPPLPMLPASTALPPSRVQIRIVVLVVALFVALATVVGYQGLGPINGNSLSLPRRTKTAVAPPVTVPASPAPQAAKTAAGPIAILSATGFDPEGDQREGNSEAARVYDGDLATTWSSELYATASFGNLKKGVGVILDLGQPTAIHQVTIDLGKGPVDVRAYAATDPSLKGATLIGRATGATDRTQLTAKATMPQTQFVVIWFTRLAEDSGQYRASISEIALT
jgi:hypothetical protein